MSGTLRAGVRPDNWNSCLIHRKLCRMSVSNFKPSTILCFQNMLAELEENIFEVKHPENGDPSRVPFALLIARFSLVCSPEVVNAFRKFLEVLAVGFAFRTDSVFVVVLPGDYGDDEKGSSSDTTPFRRVAAIELTSGSFVQIGEVFVFPVSILQFGTLGHWKFCLYPIL